MDINDRLKSRIPRLPHWRWVLYKGRGHLDYDEAMAQLERYISEEDVEVELPDPEDSDTQRAIRIFTDEPPIRRILEQMLYERCSNELIEEALYHKFKELISEDVVEKYRTYFYDTGVMNNYDIDRYYESHGTPLPKRLPVPGSMKEAYIAYKNGVSADIDIQSAMNHMFQTSFFRAQELRELGWVADEKVIKYQKNAMDVVKTMNDGELGTDLPDAFEIKIEYPSETATHISEVEGFDPGDDPNEVTHE